MILGIIKEIMQTRNILMFLAGIILFIIGIKIAKKILLILAVLVIIATIAITIIF